MKLTNSIFEQLDNRLFPGAIGNATNICIHNPLLNQLQKEIYYSLGDMLYTRLYTTLDDAFNDILPI